MALSCVRTVHLSAADTSPSTASITARRSLAPHNPDLAVVSLGTRGFKTSMSAVWAVMEGMRLLPSGLPVTAVTIFAPAEITCTVAEIMVQVVAVRLDLGPGRLSDVALLVDKGHSMSSVQVVSPNDMAKATSCTFEHIFHFIRVLLAYRPKCPQ
jgi:hypothetical protein